MDTAISNEPPLAVPEQLASLVDTVVEVPPLRHRAEDILTLAHLFARQERRRDLEFSLPPLPSSRPR